MRRFVKEYATYVKTKGELAYKKSYEEDLPIGRIDIQHMIDDADKCARLADANMICITDAMVALSEIDSRLMFMHMIDY